jgi:hypothetical protein
VVVAYMPPVMSDGRRLIYVANGMVRCRGRASTVSLLFPTWFFLKKNLTNPCVPCTAGDAEAVLSYNDGKVEAVSTKHATSSRKYGRHTIFSLALPFQWLSPRALDAQACHRSISVFSRQ